MSVSQVSPMHQDQNAIEVENVTMQFGHRTLLTGRSATVFDSLSLTVPYGQTLCLLGPSGCGKTTLVNLIMGILIPTAGTVRIMGELAPYPKARFRIGYMPQDDALYTDITALDNLRFFAAMEGMKKKAIEKRSAELLEFMHLVDDKNKLVSAFSGGMKRRLSLAIALMHKPDLLILDEPTVGLDPDHRRRIWDELDRLADNGTTILVTTHVMDEAARCKMVAMLHGGKLIALGSPVSILESTQSDTLEDAFLALESASEMKGGAHHE